MSLLALLAGWLLLAGPQNVRNLPPLPTSDLIDYGRAITRDKGYDVANTKVYSLYIFEPDPRAFVPGYTEIQVEVNEHPLLLLLLNNSTGQVIEFNYCEVYDYPDLKAWQDRFHNAIRKTPDELSSDVGCNPPKVLSQPAPIRKQP